MSLSDVLLDIIVNHSDGKVSLSWFFNISHKREYLTVNFVHTDELKFLSEGGCGYCADYIK
jgi:hypothetical protein